MPVCHIEYGVLYHIERGPSRESIYDCARLGHRPKFLIEFELRGDYRDYILSGVKASVEGVHRVGIDPRMLFIMGRLAMERSYDGTPLTEIWQKGFYFARYNLDTHRGRILFAERSFLESPLDAFGPFKEAAPEI